MADTLGYVIAAELRRQRVDGVNLDALEKAVQDWIDAEEAIRALGAIEDDNEAFHSTNLSEG